MPYICTRKTEVGGALVQKFGSYAECKMRK